MSGGSVEQLDHAESLRIRMRCLLEDASTHDIVFVAGPSAVRIGAHRNVVKCASAPLGAMVYSDMKEGRERDVVLPMADPGAFRKFLSYIYTGEIDLDAISAISLLKLSDMYGVTVLHDACHELLHRHGSINEANACSALNLSLSLEITEVSEICMNIIALNGNACLKQLDFAKLPVKVIENILSRDDLVADEVTVFNAFLMWYKTEDESEPKQHQDVQRLKELVRLPQIPMDQLLGVVDDSGVFSRDEIFVALKHQSHPKRSENTTDKRFKKRLRRMPAWVLSPLMSNIQSWRNSITPTSNGTFVKKNGDQAKSWDFLAMTSLAGGSNTENSTKFRCQIRIDHINDDKSGLVIGAIDGSGDPNRFMSCYGIGGNGSIYNVTRLNVGGQRSLNVDDVVTVSIDASRRRVEIHVCRGVDIFLNAAGEYPATWKAGDDGKGVSLGIFLHFPDDAVTIVGS